MIRVTCPACQSKLHAKEELAGKTRKCPRCGTPLRIPPSGPPKSQTAPGSTSEVRVGQTPGLPVFRPPERLSRLSHYLICDRTRVVAAWQSNGEGWTIHGEFGFVSAQRNQEKLPNEGDFKLVELQMAMHQSGFRLRGVRVFRLAKRWALLNLARGDDAILKAVTGPAPLLREQKNVIRQHLKEHFMPQVWEDSHAVTEYLAIHDYHSPGTSE